MVMRQKAMPPIELRDLTERRIISALAANQPDDPIVVEVARLIEIYASRFKVSRQRLSNPEGFFQDKPATAIEAVALRLALRSLAQGEGTA